MHSRRSPSSPRGGAGRGGRGPPIAALLAGLAVATGTMRVLLPLQYLDHRTQMVRVREQIDATRARGVEPRLPIPLQEGGELKVRALFARDFEIVSGRPPVAWWLYAPGDPRAVGSIRRGPPGGPMP